jgi:hypothetical protein
MNKHLPLHFIPAFNFSPAIDSLFPGRALIVSSGQHGQMIFNHTRAMASLCFNEVSCPATKIIFKENCSAPLKKMQTLPFTQGSLLSLSKYSAQSH